MKRRVITLIALSLFVCLIGSGCGGRSQPGQGSQAIPQSPPAQANPSAPAASSNSPPAPPAENESIADLTAKGRDIKRLSFDYTLKMTTGKMDARVWIDGKKMKCEIDLAGQKTTTIIDGEAGVAYTCNLEQKIATKMPIGDKVFVPETPLDYSQRIDPALSQILDTVDFKGSRCKILEMKSPDGSKTKMWISEVYGMPIRVEVTGPEGTTLEIEYSNIKIGPVPADTFDLPAGIKVTDLTEMMKQAPTMPGTTVPANP